AANRNQVARVEEARERAEVLHAPWVVGIAERILKHRFVAIGNAAADRDRAPPVVATDFGLQRNVDDVLPYLLPVMHAARDVVESLFRDFARERVERHAPAVAFGVGINDLAERADTRDLRFLLGRE